jgi:hypothetical protein
MTKSVAGKLGMNPGMRALIVTPPPEYLKLLAPLPDGLIVSSTAHGVYPFVQIFNPAAFIAPPSASGFYGNAARDVVGGPGLAPGILLC